MKRHKYLISKLCLIFSPILFIIGVLVSNTSGSFFKMEQNPTIFWFFTALSIVLLISGIVFNFIGYSKKEP